MPTTEEDESVTPSAPEPFPTMSRSRAATSSTSTTVTPPKVDGEFDLGGDFGKILLGDKRASVATVRDDQNSGQSSAPRTLTSSRMNQPSPIQIDKGSKIEAPPHSWSSNHSGDGLLSSTSPAFSPPANDRAPPVPQHATLSAPTPGFPGSSLAQDSRKPSLGPRYSSNELAEADDEEARLLRDSLSTVSKFMTGKTPGAPSTSRYRRNEGDDNDDDESLFDTSHSYSVRSSNRFSPQGSNAQQSNKVMTPAEFESYRKDKERQDRRHDTFSHAKSKPDNDDDDDDHYEEDEDDIEKAKQQAKQRRKQEAHMAVYRQQMMKVTGEAANAPPRPSLSISFSTPNLPNLGSGPGRGPEANTSENSDDDEEVPLAILAAHGFPNKARPPNRLSTMMSNPNLRASQQPSYQRPVSAVPEPPAGGGGARLPAFARNLPQDPFLGAGLIRNSVRESFALGGGASTSSLPGSSVPPGGLIGVIANEERSRALRRGSPHIDNQMGGPGGMPFDPIGGIPPQMMYPNNPSPTLTPGDHAQIQMTQQMQQFMQMQMQFMQMMTAQNGSNAGMSGMPGIMGAPSMLGVPGGPEMMRHSFVANDSAPDLLSARGDVALRTMSMVQPSSASWIQRPGFAPSIRIQGGGYAPSIAPSERSNVGLPGRYRPVSHVPPPNPVGQGHLRNTSTMSGAIQPVIAVTKSASASDDDDEEGWEAMKAKRDKKKSLWRTKKGSGSDLGAFFK